MGRIGEGARLPTSFVIDSRSLSGLGLLYVIQRAKLTP